MVKKILVIDDEVDILTSMKQLLESWSYEVLTVNNGEDGLRLLNEQSFDLVLLDLLMPGMSGREVFKKIRESDKLKDQKVALFTVARLDKYGGDGIQDLNPVGYFEKPINIPAFERNLKNILGRET